MANPVVFGLNNVHVAPYNDETNTYETPIRIPGAVSLKLTRQGQSSTFYADNSPYFAQDTNGGYTGELEMAYLPDEILKKLLGYVEDANGALIEDTNATQKTFALLYEVNSNVNPTRFAFYNCVMSRPEMEAKTSTDTTDPDTQKMDVTMIAREFAFGSGVTLSAIKAHITKTAENTAVYNSFYTKVMEPKATA